MDDHCLKKEQFVIHSFRQLIHILSAYFMPGTVLVSGDNVLNK